MVYVSAADEVDARFGAAQIRQQFASMQSDGVHPDTVQQHRGMVHEKRTADIRAGVELRADPRCLLGVNPAGHRTGNMSINTKAQPAGWGKAKANGVIRSAGNAVTEGPA